jgi:MOSC domain-containing protein YiiM
MRAKKLFIKHEHGAQLIPADSIDFSPDGIATNVTCAPFRQVLLASDSVTAGCGLRDGDLRENVVVDCDGLYDLPSGTVVQIGQALIRLTFHCEPCKKILKLVDFKTILHRRGVFGTFLNAGRISVGDEFTVTPQTLEPIPYEIGERILWFFRRHGGSAAMADLAHAIGLPASYRRAIPSLLRKASAG